MNKNVFGTGVMMVLIFAAGIFLGYYFGINATPALDNETEVVNDGSVTAKVPEEGIKVDSTVLSEGQRKMLETLGVDTENIVITAEMVACAEAKIGSARLIEIQNGASPTTMEGVALAACYK